MDILVTTTYHIQATLVLNKTVLEQQNFSLKLAGITIYCAKSQGLISSSKTWQTCTLPPSILNKMQDDSLLTGLHSDELILS